MPSPSPTPHRHASECWHPRLSFHTRHDEALALQTARKRFFFEKKKQKTSAYRGPCRAPANAPKDQKFFASFFQKRSASCLNQAT
jgi:hypothetical protein